MATSNNSSAVMQWTANTLINNGATITAAPINTAVDAAMIVNKGKMQITVPLDLNGIDVEQVLKDLMLATGVVARNRNLESEYSGMRKAGEIYQETLQNAQLDANIKIKKAGDNYRRAEEKYKTFNLIKESA